MKKESRSSVLPTTIWILPKTVAVSATCLKELEIPYPDYGTAHDVDEAIEVANKVGYPVLVRPSYVLGGQRMRIVINDDEVEKAVVSLLKHIPGNKILIDHFLDRCQEAEIDAIFDGEDFHVMGVMEHIEPAGIHSGDSNAVLPAFNLVAIDRIHHGRICGKNCKSIKYQRAHQYSVCH